ncbi:MAG: SDR family oxidoreductase [Planctomycetes bacterium]|nr:SDR family oxidoreductase [Planctomycetota bacterium]
MKDTLIIGATGQVGGALRKAMPDARVTKRPEVDIRDRAAVERACAGAQTVILAAALTAVDYCEDHPNEARAINVEGTRNVARVAPHLIYLSTEYVFDGEGGPYGEDDAPSPLSVYGRTKLEGELAAREAKQWTIVRTTVVFSYRPGSKNFLMQVLSGKPMRIPVDQISNPTLAENLAEAIVELAQRRLTGIWNLVGADRLDRYDFATRIAERFELDASQLTPVSTRELAQPAARPLNAGLKIDKARRELKTRLLTVDEALNMARRQWRLGARP